MEHSSVPWWSEWSNRACRDGALEAAVVEEVAKGGDCSSADAETSARLSHVCQDQETQLLQKQIEMCLTQSWSACKFDQTQLLYEQIASIEEDWNGQGWQLLVATDDKKRTLLHIASRFGSAGCVRLLLDTGAKVDAEEWYGATPLFFACQAGQLECAQLLIAHGAQPQAVSISCGYGQLPQSVDPLESLGPLDFCTNGETCLLVACRTAQPELVRLLLSSGSSIFEELRDGTPLHHLCKPARGRPIPAALVTPDGALVTPDGAEQCLQLLLSASSTTDEAILDRKDSYGNTALHLACRHAPVRPGLVDGLLKAGASVQAVNRDGKTPLHVALLKPCDEATAVVQLLLEAGSDVLFKDTGGKIPLEAVMCLREVMYASDNLVCIARGEALVKLLHRPTATAKAALVESRRAERMLEVAKRREQEAKQTAAAATEQERHARESAPALATQKARREAEAAALEEQRRAFAAEAAAKLAAERATAEASLVLVREKAALAEAAERVESQKALAARKAAAAEQAQRVEEAKRAKGAEEDAKQMAKQKDAADAKKLAKQEKKERKKAPSAFKLQHEQEERAREEQRVEEQRAKELAAAQERQQDALQAAKRRSVEHRAAELMAAEREIGGETTGPTGEAAEAACAGPGELSALDTVGGSGSGLGRTGRGGRGSGGGRGGRGVRGGTTTPSSTQVVAVVAATQVAEAATGGDLSLLEQRLLLISQTT